MDYQFVKTLYEQLEEHDLRKYKDKAYGMIDYAKKKLGNREFSKHYFGGIQKALQLFDDKYCGMTTYPDVDIELEQQLPVNKTSWNQCAFITFLVKECGLSLKSCYGDKYLSFFNLLLRSMGKDVLINACMDDAILYFCLSTEQDWTFWVDWQAKWREEKKERKTSDIGQIWKTLPYRDFFFRIDEGLEIVKDVKATRRTFLITDQKITEIVEKHKGIKCTVEDIPVIFSEDIIEVLEEAEKRRTWYLYRMMSMIIDRQIEECVIALREYKAMPKTKISHKRLMDAMKVCWLRTGNGAFNLRNAMRSAAFLNELTESNLREYLLDMHIKLEKVGEKLQFCLSGYKENVFQKAKYRYLFQYECDKEDETFRKNAVMRRNYLGDSSESKKSMSENRSTRLLRALFSGEKNTTKEMLMLFALFAKSHGCTQITYDYVSAHILANCRFDMEISEENIFNQFFFKSFENIKKLQEYAMWLERRYLMDNKGAVFYNIIRGKEL